MSIFLKKLIPEGLKKNRTKSLGKDEFRYLLTTKCSQAFHSKISLFRGYRDVKTIGDFGVIDPSTIERFTRDASNNIYTVLLSTLPSWDGWPPRSFSVFMSQNRNISADYGYLYRVFPFNGAKIVVSPVVDVIDFTFGDYADYQINTNFSPVRTIMLFYSKHRQKFSEWLGDSEKINTNTISQFLDDLNKFVTIDVLKDKLSSFDRSCGDRYDINKTLIALQKHNGDWKSLLNDVFNPTTNGFRLTNINELWKTDNECWTDSKCLLMRDTDLNYDLLKRTN